MKTAPRRGEHQVRALTKLAERRLPRAQIHWPCSTGKTFVGRWYAEDMDAQRAIVLLPSLALVAQTLAEWQVAGNWDFAPMVVCSDPSAADSWRVEDGWWADHGVTVTTDRAPVAEFLARNRAPHRVVFSTYHSAHVVGEAMSRTGTVADVMVLEEAHHLAGNPSTQFRVALDDEQMPARRRLFTTATPVYTSTGALSMDNKAVFGPVVDRMDFEEALDWDLLVDYKVVVIDSNDEAAKLTASTAAPAAIAAGVRLGARRMITFHSRVAGARQLASAIDGVELPDGQKIRSAAVAGTDPASKRIKILADLGDTSTDGVVVVPNARCLNEGVDVPAVDAVVQVDPKSAHDTIQGIGRVLRKSPGKIQGLVILPVVVPEGADLDEEMYSGRFAAVWGVLRALRNLDPRMAAELERAARAPGDEETVNGGSRGNSWTGSRVEFHVEGLDLSAFAGRIVDDRSFNQASWDTNLELVRAWALEHGHTAVPLQAKAQGRFIGRWVQAQRKAYAAGALSPERGSALNTIIGWGWTTEAAWWHADLAVVMTAAGKRLDLEDPAVSSTRLSHRPGKLKTTVGRWCAFQRRAWRDGHLSSSQIRDCESVPGWSWNAGVPERELEMVDALAEYVESWGDANVPHDRNWDEVPLGKFITAVRRRRVMGRLSLALTLDIETVTPRKYAVDGTPMDWRVEDTRWELCLLTLRQFQEERGNLDIPENHVEEFRGWPVHLYQWCTRQRYLGRRHGELSRERRLQLEKVPGWEWERTRKTRVRMDIGQREHGTRAGYAAGCTCDDCTEANRVSNAAREAKIAAGEPTTSRVDAAVARGHLRVLDAQVGWRARPAMQEVTGLNKKTIDEIINGTRARITDWVNETVMKLTAERLSDHIAANPSPVDPLPEGPTLVLISHMEMLGWDRSWINREIGGIGPLQIGRRRNLSGTVHRRTAEAIADLHERIGGRRAPKRSPREPLPTLADVIDTEQRGVAA